MSKKKHVGAGTPALVALEATVSSMEPDRMTPLEALTALAALKKSIAK